MLPLGIERFEDAWKNRSIMIQRAERKIGPADAEDVVSDAYMGFLRNGPENVEFPRTFVSRAVDNRSIDELRRRSARPTVSLDDREEWRKGVCVVDFDSRLRYEEIETALTTLPLLSQRILRLTAEGDSDAQIAQELGVSKDVVKVRRLRARRALQSILRE